MFTSVLDMLDHTAERYPAKDAFICGEDALSFRAFQKVTMSLGTALAGVIREKAPVIVMAGRGVLTPALFLSVVRAGGFYAPIDAGMPEARLRQMINVAQAEFMLVDREHLAAAEKLGFGGKILVAEDLLETQPDPVLLSGIRGRALETDPLYVIFTSGSTGVPKGVVTSHQSVMCYIDAVSEVLRVDDTDVFGGQAPLDYIAAVRDIYLPLYTGCSTVIIPKNEFSMPGELMDTLNRNHVTALCWSVAGAELPIKLGAFPDMKPEFLKKLCFSGSVMPGKYLKAWQETLPDVLYVNQYGPTEATASCTYYVVKEKAEDDTVLPIGRPYKHYRILLLTEDGREAAPGELGEICVAGPCLALGYYNSPERTAESFVRNPLNDAYYERIYKTGDLGLFREDGELEFHGRRDRQIKHMGHRIELEEIETKARSIPGVLECAALYQKEKELLYLFYKGEASARDITLAFRKSLPAFMVPRKIVSLEELPKLPNGKTDMNTLKGYFK